MNNTKWNEIFQAFYYDNELKTDHPLIQWRTKDRENGYICSWDGTWTHFGCDARNWERIEYLQIRLTYENKEIVLKSLHKIHVPGIVEDDVVTIYGYRMDVDYL